MGGGVSKMGKIYGLCLNIFLKLAVKLSESEGHSVVSDSLRPHRLYSPRNSPDQNAKVGSISLLQGFFPTQKLKPGLPHCSLIL